MNRSSSFLAVLLVLLLAAAVWRGSALVAGEFTTPPVPSAKPIDLAKLDNAPNSALLPAGWPRPLFARSDAADAGRSQTNRIVPENETPRLIGIALDGEYRIAVLSHNNVVLRLRQGDKVGKWTITQIKVRSAVMRAGEQSEVLELDR